MTTVKSRQSNQWWIPHERILRVTLSNCNLLQWWIPPLESYSTSTYPCSLLLSSLYSRTPKIIKEVKIDKVFFLLSSTGHPSLYGQKVMTVQLYSCPEIYLYCHDCLPMQTGSAVSLMASWRQQKKHLANLYSFNNLWVEWSGWDWKMFQQVSIVYSMYNTLRTKVCQFFGTIGMYNTSYADKCSPYIKKCRSYLRRMYKIAL